MFWRDTKCPPLLALWLCAAIAALALHVGGAALAIARISGPAGDGSLGASASEIGIDLASPPADATDFPLGPDTDPTPFSPPASQQKADAKPNDLPKDTPNETDNPDRVVTQNESKKPTDDPKVEKVQAAAAEDSPPVDATSQQVFEAPRESETSTAPNIGIGDDKQQLTADWGRKVSAYFALHKRFPKVQKREARVMVTFSLNRQGHVLSVAVLESSGDPAYDEAAVDMIRRSDPVPRPPAKLTDESLSFTLPVVFRVKDGS